MENIVFFGDIMIADKRIIRTRNNIKNAFITLSVDKDPKKITVAEISENAQINRSTFYLHYENIEGVKKDINNEIELSVAAFINNYDITNVYNSNYILFTNITETLERMDEVKKYILHSFDSKNIIQNLKDIFIKKTKESLLVSVPLQNTPKLDYYITFLTSGIIDSYIKWTYEDTKQISLEELSDAVSEMIELVVAQWKNNNE